jgi:hypothetical protein
VTVDIVRADNNALAALGGGASEAMARLGQWVEAASHAHQLVAPLVDTAFIPDAYKPKVDPRATPEAKKAAYDVAVANATAAVLQGLSLGLDPLVALQQIYIVHGRPGMYTKMKVALVQSRGHEIWTEDLSDTRAVVCGRRKGTDYVERVTVTMDMARKAGWTKNDNYNKTPQDMLYARAAGRVCDRIAPEVLLGIASVEEIQDTIQVEATAGNGTRTVTPPKRRPASPAVTAAIAAATEQEPPLDDEPEPVQAPAAPVESEPPAEKTITPTQSRKLHALLRDTGRSDREFALAHITTLIDRDIESTKDLTLAEADDVIAALLAEKAEQNVATDPEPALDGELWPEAEKPGGES